MPIQHLFAFTLCILLTSTLASAENIDLQCEQMAEKMITRLRQENLLNTSESNDYRVKTISLQVCKDNQHSIQQQHDEAVQNALQNWFTESTGGKPGNKRLKNLKR